MRLKEKLKQLKQKTAEIYVAIKSPKTPWYAKILGALVVAYSLSPIDIIPDFVPILGYLDELLLIPLGVFLTMKLIPKDLWDEFQEEAKTIWKNGKPEKWYYAIPVVVLWVSLALIVIRMIVK